MIFFVNFILFTMSIFLLPGISAQPPEKVYSKLSGNLVDHFYAWLLQAGQVSSSGMCAIRCSLQEKCTLFQFKDGQCEVFKQETIPGIGIISLNNMTEVWRIDTGNVEQGEKVILSYHLVQLIQ